MRRLLSLLAAAALISSAAAYAGYIGQSGMSRIGKKSVFLSRKQAPPPLPVSSASPKTSSVWFTSNGVLTKTSVQGNILTWAADCLIQDTLRWEIWLDANDNGQFDTTGASRDRLLFYYNVANGDTEGDEGLPDTTYIPDNEIVNRFKTFFAPARYWFRAISLVDHSQAFDSLRVLPLPSPWATVSGQVVVPGETSLQAGLWLMAEFDDENNEDLWAGITDNAGNYVINFDNTIQNQVWQIGGLEDLVGASNVYVAPPDTLVLVHAGSNPGVNFTYQVATDSITGEVAIHGGGSLPFEVSVWAQNQYGREKHRQVENGHYQIFFTAQDAGTWDIGIWWNDNITSFMRPSQRSGLVPVGAGHLVENFTVYPADVMVQGTILENGNPAVNQYRISAWSNTYQMYNHVLSQPLSGVYTLYLSDLENQSSIEVSRWDDEHPIPQGWMVIPQNYYPVDPPASGLDFNLIPATEAITGTITQDPGDAVMINFNQVGIQANGRGPQHNFGTSPEGSGWYFLPVVADTYQIGAWGQGFLFKPSTIMDLVVLPNDTVEGVNFTANYGHCQVEVVLIGYPAGHQNWIAAQDNDGWPNGYICGEQVNGPGTYNLYICNSNGWMVFAPQVDGYNLSPGNYTIGDITHADTYRGPYNFVYTPSGVAGRPEIAKPQTFALHQSRPNPVSASAEISFQLPVAGVVSLTIYNILGQEVRSWSQANMEPGYHSVKWDGRDSRGALVPNGVYLYRLKAGNFAATRRLSVLR